MPEKVPFDFPCFLWSEITSTGIDDRQLRNALDRKLVTLGTKRAGRLMFSLRERLVVDLIATLTALWLPISVACSVSKTMSESMEHVLDAFLALPSEQMMLCMFNQDGNLKIEVVKSSELPDKIIGAVVVSLTLLCRRQVEWVNRQGAALLEVDETVSHE